MKLFKVDKSKLEECINEFRKLKQYLPRVSKEYWDAYLMEWAQFKRRVAEAAGMCLKKLLPGIIEEVYYIDFTAAFSDDYTGRDIDLLVKIKKNSLNYPPKVVEEELEKLLTSIAKEAGIDYEKYNESPHLFEVHTSEKGVYGSRKVPVVFRVG